MDLDLVLLGMCAMSVLLWVLLAGCATKVGWGEGDTMLRQYPVPIEFYIAEGATNNTQ
jgi:hypothetical protein